MLWDDENEDERNELGGEVPEGTYDSDTKIWYCCREDGFASNPIYLPTDNPFFLLRNGHQCQKVSYFLLCFVIKMLHTSPKPDH